MAIIRFKALVARPVDYGAFEAEMRRIASEAERDLRRYFEGTTEGWEHTVKWVSVRRVGGSQMLVAFGTNDEIYGYVSEGTRPHPITARRGGRLRFQTGYSRSTRRGSLRSRRSRRSGPFVYARRVQHPGYEGVEFPEQIVKDYQPRFERLARDGFARAARRSQGG